jgi:peptidoglycan-N-acetylglucosamine deacetylase
MIATLANWLSIPNNLFTLPNIGMRNYLVKTPRLLKAMYKSCIWHINTHANSIYITFDDGPHPEITPKVLAILEKFNAKATFFCVGENVKKYPEIVNQILAQGHTIGNHTNNHYNGWKTDTALYLQNIKEASSVIQSNLFRPPYGRITNSQIKGIAAQHQDMKIVMWDVLTGDFDVDLSPEKCLQMAIGSTKPGSIIVFHDSEKAWKRLQFALPRYLQHCQQNAWNMKSLRF